MACRPDMSASFWPDLPPNRRQSVQISCPKGLWGRRKCASTWGRDIWPGGQMRSKKMDQFGTRGDASQTNPGGSRAPVVPESQRRPRSRNPFVRDVIRTPMVCNVGRPSAAQLGRIVRPGRGC